MVLMFDTKNWINNVLRPLVGGIDSLIYSLLGWIVEGIFNLSNIMANPTFVEILYKRVYVVLGIFMIFKLTFSFLKYLISPDSMTDKEHGVGKLIGRTLIMVVMLIALPILFFETNWLGEERGTLLNQVQNAGIKTLPRLILGLEDNESNIADNAKASGKSMALMMLRSFYYPSTCGSENDDAAATEECNFNNDEESIATIEEFNRSIIDGEKGKDYTYHYMWPLSTVAGILLVVIMLGICIDVAIRSFKLIVLQMLAPIPVMSYIDPKSSKDGAFSSWLKTFTSTFLDIFVKLGLVYLVLLLISKLFSTDKYSLFGDSASFGQTGMSRNFVRIFLIIGLMKFAKEAPKFIKDALGIKDKGGGGGFMGKALAGLGGAAAGFAGGVAAGGIAGGLSGAMQGASGAAAASGTNKPFKAFSNARDDAAKMRTGNQNARGGILGKAQNASMAAEGRKLARKEFGLTSNAAKNGTLDMMKKDNLNKKTEASGASEILSMYNNSSTRAGAIDEKLRTMVKDYDTNGNPLSYYNDFNDYIGTAIMRGGYTGTDGEILNKMNDDLATKSSKSDSAYQEASKKAESMHVKRGFEKYTRGGRFKDKVDNKLHNTPTINDRRAQKKADDIGWNK